MRRPVCTQPSYSQAVAEATPAALGMQKCEPIHKSLLQFAGPLVQLCTPCTAIFMSSAHD